MFFYHVDVGVCSCIFGIQGAFCKHQAAVHKKYGLMFPNAPVLSDAEKCSYYSIALGSQNVSLDFLGPMVNDTIIEDYNNENCDTHLKKKILLLQMRQKMNHIMYLSIVILQVLRQVKIIIKMKFYYSFVNRWIESKG